MFTDRGTMTHNVLLAGFERGPQAQQGRTALACLLHPLEEGRWHVHVTIRALKETKDALLFANCRRLVWRGDLCAQSEITISFFCLLAPTLPDGAKEPVPCRGLELALAAPGAQIIDVKAEKADCPALLLMGDSTVTDQRTFSPYAPGATYCGWGQMMPLFVGGGMCVGNYARSGLTAETFRTLGCYDLMRAQVRPGDLVLMQFGHNDQKRPHLQARGGYSDALRTYIDELRAMGAKPALVTPLARNSWWNETEYNDLLGHFSDALKCIAKDKQVPVIDLHRFMMNELLSCGREAAKVLFHTGDYTHPNDFGAHLAAGYVAGELRRQGIADARNHAEWTPHGPYDVPAADKGDESLPPTGLEALYAACETERANEPLTRMEAIELICRTCALFAHNEDTPLPADIAPDAPQAGDVRCAIQSRLLEAALLQDGRLCPDSAIAPAQFNAMLARAYRMRCTGDAPKAQEADILTRQEAAAVCRRVKI